MAFLLADLHDATLVSIDFTWQTGTVAVYMNTSDNPNFKLTITEVKRISGTRNFEWGRSEQVNSLTISGETLMIEMQSGDVIQITGLLTL